MVDINVLNKNLANEYIDALVQTDKEAVDEFGDLFSSETWEGKNFLADYEGKWDLSLLATINEQLAGYCICSVINMNECYVYRFVVGKQFRNQRIGSQMINVLFDQCRQNKLKKILLEVNMENKEAVTFYNRFGFKNLENEILKQYLNSKGKLEVSLVHDNYFEEENFPEKKYVLEGLLA